MSKIIETLRKKIPLKTRLQVINEMFIMSFLVDSGYIPEGYWSDEKEDLYGKELRAFAKKLTNAQIEEFNTWVKDRRPE